MSKRVKRHQDRPDKLLTKALLYPRDISLSISFSRFPVLHFGYDLLLVIISDCLSPSLFSMRPRPRGFVGGGQKYGGMRRERGNSPLR